MHISNKTKVGIIVQRIIILIGVGILFHILFVLWAADISYLKKINIIYIALLVPLAILPWLGYALRIWMWARFLKERITYKECIQLVITADVTSAISPTAVGGAPVKAGLLIHKGFQPGHVGFLLTLGIIEDIIFYTTGIIIASIFSKDLLIRLCANLVDAINKYSFEIICLCLLAIFIFWIAYKLLYSWTALKKLKHNLDTYSQKLTQSFRDMRHAFWTAMSSGKKYFTLSLIILFIQWIIKFSVLGVILISLGFEFEWAQIYIRQWVVYITMLLVPTPGASGGAEASFLLIFGHSLPNDFQYLLVALWRFFTYYLVLIIAVVSYLALSVANTPSNNETSSPN